MLRNHFHDFLKVFIAVVVNDDGGEGVVGGGGSDGGVGGAGGGGSSGDGGGAGAGMCAHTHVGIHPTVCK